MPVLKPELVKLKQFVVSGIMVRTKNEDEFIPKTSKLPRLWEQFFKMEIPQRKSTSPIYGVYSEYESDCNGFYNVTAGIEMDCLDEAVQLSRVSVRKGDYLIFRNSGPMPQAIIGAWEAVWDYFKSNPHIIRAYDTDFEMSMGLEECAVYVGINE